jgi:hypothetical protein
LDDGDREYRPSKSIWATWNLNRDIAGNGGLVASPRLSQELFLWNRSEDVTRSWLDADEDGSVVQRVDM